MTTAQLETVIDQAFTGITFPDHTFLMRKAPKLSSCFGDGYVYGEIRCAGNLSAMSVLRILEIPYTVVETWVHPSKGWKLLRFKAECQADLLRLHESCGSPDIQSRDLETQGWLAAIAADVSLLKSELLELAQLVEIPNCKRMTKPQLVEALVAPIAA